MRPWSQVEGLSPVDLEGVTLDEPEVGSIAELLPQDSITRKLRFLPSEIFDHVLLVSIDPASEGQHQKLRR